MAETRFVDLLLDVVLLHAYDPIICPNGKVKAGCAECLWEADEAGNNIAKHRDHVISEMKKVLDAAGY